MEVKYYTGKLKIPCDECGKYAGYVLLVRLWKTFLCFQCLVSLKESVTNTLAQVPE